MKILLLLLAVGIGGAIADGGFHNRQHNGRRAGRGRGGRSRNGFARRGRQESALSSYGAAPADSNGGQPDYNSAAGSNGGFSDYDAAASDDSFAGSAAGGGDDNLAMLEKSVPGVPGEDYPIYAQVPETAFVCDGQVDGGYYADPEAECQVFHICTADGLGGLAKYSFLCPNGTVFNQNYFICDWWFNFDCADAEGLYSKNEEIAAEREAASAAAADNAAAASSDAAQASYGAPANNDYGSNDYGSDYGSSDYETQESAAPQSNYGAAPAAPPAPAPAPEAPLDSYEAGREGRRFRGGRQQGRQGRRQGGRRQQGGRGRARSGRRFQG